MEDSNNDLNNTKDFEPSNKKNLDDRIFLFGKKIDFIKNLLCDFIPKDENEDFIDINNEYINYKFQNNDSLINFLSDYCKSKTDFTKSIKIKNNFLSSSNNDFLNKKRENIIKSKYFEDIFESKK